MGAFQRLTEGRPWGGYRSPWLCWACKPCWAWWWTPSIMSTMATQLKSCRSSLRTRRQAWLWKRWFMTELTATAGFRRLPFHRLSPVPLRHRLTRSNNNNNNNHNNHHNREYYHRIFITVFLLLLLLIFFFFIVILLFILFLIFLFIFIHNNNDNNNKRW